MDNKDQEERNIRKMLNDYAASSPYRLHPDARIVNSVIRGLAIRKIKYGHAYCPCRLITGNSESDKKIICPCVYHQEEIEREEECHCSLFVSDHYQGKEPHDRE
ncbi:MAG: ferredoxin-thioredoxin reductase catalytic domain-containing protein [Candidatus Loosdrechtia sp.]|uniref:ferredoxin-thioredoxin reductase catalytic domain-containing protein n=1 Tax=Candidatus Loosdrechtia sp. TaxID=3101272 RepID=UPI003A710060|nr:MAG: ferredoxin-thioredoxin reductase catalytic domain-containing protein [Candidatus Jettenia sp. AMX2]